jgi:hypothetical protein
MRQVFNTADSKFSVVNIIVWCRVCVEQPGCVLLPPLLLLLPQVH